MKFLIELLTGKLNAELQENEIEIYSDGANLFRDAQAVGGKLVLTNERLIFLPHSLNFNREQEYLELSKISSTKRVRTMDLIDNGLRVTLHNDVELKFVLNNRETWIKILEETKAKIPNS